MAVMATVVRDPREIITPDAFRVADHLIGVPLARPARRLGAMLVDLLLVGILVSLLDAIGLLIALVGAFLVFRLSRGTSDRWYKRWARRGLGCFGAVLVFSGVLVIWEAMSEDDEGTPATVAADSAHIEIQGLSMLQGARLLLDGAALRSATRDGERDSLAARIVGRLAAAGVPPGQMRAAVDDLAEAATIPGPAVAALHAALDTSGAAGMAAVPAYAPTVEPGDSAGPGTAASDRAGLAGDSGPAPAAPADAALLAVRDTMADLRARLRDTQTELAEEQTAHEAARARLDQGAFRWILSSVADEAGLGLGWLGLYFTAFTVLGRGQTPGKRLFRLRVIRLDGAPIGWWMSLQRFGGYSASVFTGLLGFAECMWDANRQALQDKLAHTVVVQEHPSVAPAGDGTAPYAADTPAEMPGPDPQAPTDPHDASDPQAPAGPHGSADPREASAPEADPHDASDPQAPAGPEPATDEATSDDDGAATRPQEPPR